MNEAFDKILAFRDGENDDLTGVSSVKLPLVTVVITNYNYEKYLEEAIISVLAIDYPNVQRIIIDDCSTDSSLSIVGKYKDKFEIVRHDVNKGQLASFFTGLDNVKGEFTIFIDADDTVDPSIVNAHLSLHLLEKPYVAFTCVRNKQISANGAVLSFHHLDFKGLGKITKFKPRLIHNASWSWATTSAMMFRTDVLRLIRTDNTAPFRICADYYIVHFSNLLGGSMLLNLPLANYRRHGSNNFSKNFIIGGAKPTGNLVIHNHPSHKLLQNEILRQMLDRRADFEPYYNNFGHYCTMLCYVDKNENISTNFPQHVDANFRRELLKSSKILQKTFGPDRVVNFLLGYLDRWKCIFKRLKKLNSYNVDTFCEG